MSLKRCQATGFAGTYQFFVQFFTPNAKQSFVISAKLVIEGWMNRGLA
jgi:hypothetical protein